MSDLDIVAMARAASYDDRLADGMLYRKLADEIERLRDRVDSRDAQLAALRVEDQPAYQQVKAERDEAKRDLANEQADMHDLCMRLNNVLDLAGVDMGEGGYDWALRQLLLERDEARALLAAVAQSGLSWTTPGYVVAQIDRTTWDAVRRIGGGA